MTPGLPENPDAVMDDFRPTQLKLLAEAWRTGPRAFLRLRSALLVNLPRQYWSDHRIDGHWIGRLKTINTLVEAAFLRLSRGLSKQLVKKMHDPLVMPYYDYLGPISATYVEKI
jgi:hypothetical protein